MDDHDILIRLNEKVDGIAESLKGLDKWQEQQQEANARHSEKIHAIQSDTERLKNTNQVWNVLNSIAGATAIFFGLRT